MLPLPGHGTRTGGAVCLYKTDGKRNLRPGGGAIYCPCRGRWWQAGSRGSTRIASRRDGLHSLIQLPPRTRRPLGYFVALGVTSRVWGRTRAAQIKTLYQPQPLMRRPLYKNQPCHPERNRRMAVESRELPNPTLYPSPKNPLNQRRKQLF